MPRRREVPKRVPLPDPKHKNLMLAKFINTVMKSGKKSLAEAIVYGALDTIKQREKADGELKIFEEAVQNAKPMLQVKSRRVGGATYQVPVEIPPATQQAIAFRWIIDFSRKRSEKSMEQRLAAELLDCYRKQGATIKRKDDMHRMAEANKAFAHLRY